MVLGRFFVALALAAWLALISLPGIVVTYLGWRLSRNMRPVLGQTVFRSGLIALTITPSIWGHGEILPAIVPAFGLQGRERPAGIVPILVVWAIAIPVLSARARKQNLDMNHHVSP